MPAIIKTYACLFLCLTTRAVHIKLCSDFSTKEFIKALKGFTARRGTLTDIYSDKESNFQGIQREMNELQQLHLTIYTQMAVGTSYLPEPLTSVVSGKPKYAS